MFLLSGMDAAQAGMLAGIRPMIEYLATPFWNKIANRFQKGKMMLLIAVASWIIFTLPIGFIHPPGMHTHSFFSYYVDFSSAGVVSWVLVGGCGAA